MSYDVYIFIIIEVNYCSLVISYFWNDQSYR